MNKFGMRGWGERMSPNFGMGRPNMPLTSINPQHKTALPQHAPIGPLMPGDSVVHYCFNVPFASDLAGPNTEDILHFTADAVLKWTHSADAPDDVPVHDLPVHTQNLANLRKMCQDITAGPQPIEAHIMSCSVKNGRGPQVVTVCLSGPMELVYQQRERIFNELPISLVRVVGNMVPPAFLLTGYCSVAPLSTSKAIWFVILPPVS